MLRFLAVALFLANLAWWAWHTPLLGLSTGESYERPLSVFFKTRERRR